MSELKPSKEMKGLIFWPIPEVSEPELVFGADSSDYFNRGSLPEVPSEFKNKAMDLFYSGGSLPRFAKSVDVDKAAKFIRSRLSSFAPPHESKESTVGYALWLWSDEEFLK